MYKKQCKTLILYPTIHMHCCCYYFTHDNIFISCSSQYWWAQTKPALKTLVLDSKSCGRSLSRKTRRERWKNKTITRSNTSPAYMINSQQRHISLPKSSDILRSKRYIYNIYYCCFYFKTIHNIFIHISHYSATFCICN